MAYFRLCKDSLHGKTARCKAWLLVIYRNRRHNGYRKEASVKESREQPKNGALKQAIEK